MVGGGGGRGKGFHHEINWHGVSSVFPSHFPASLACHMSQLSECIVTCSKKVKFIRIDGSTPAQTRGDLVNKFQQNSDVRVAILSINAAGTGLTLTVSRLLATACSQTPDAPHLVPGCFVVLQANSQAM